MSDKLNRAIDAASTPAAAATSIAGQAAGWIWLPSLEASSRWAAQMGPILLFVAGVLSALIYAVKLWREIVGLRIDRERLEEAEAHKEA